MSLATIRVFEHERLVVGQRLRSASGEVTFTNAHFDALVRFNDTCEQEYFLVGHRSLKFRHYVGYVQVGSLGIEILPKADRSAVGEADRARWHDGLLEMLRVAGGIKVHASSPALLNLQNTSLLEIFVAEFLDDVSVLLRQGLAKAYRAVEENRSAFKGRLLVAENLRENLVHAERFFVSHQTYDYATLHNQILLEALAILRRQALPPSLRTRTVQVASAFPEISRRRIRRADFERLQFGRNTRRYRRAIDLARMIILHHSPRLNAGDAELLALLFDMNALWEAYVAAVLRRAAPPDLRIRTQESRVFWRASRQRRTIRPDIVIYRAGQERPELVIDTKWKVPRDGRPADGDLKQMFAYNELFRCQRSMLLYPTEQDGGTLGVRGNFHGRHDCETFYLPLFDARAVERLFANVAATDSSLLASTNDRTISL